MNAIEKAQLHNLESKGLPVGTSLENRITWRLYRWGVLDRCQYRVDKYRLDFAWPDKLIGLEADGPFHLHPDNAAKDVVRDRFLRSLGWIIFRVDEASDCLDEQLCRVVRFIRSEQ